MSENPRMKVMLIVLGVLVAAFVVKNVVLKSDSGSTPAAVTPASTESAKVVVKKKVTTTTTTNPLAADDAFNGFETRNVFEPVIQVTPPTEPPAPVEPVAPPTTVAPAPVTTAPLPIDPTPGKQVSVLDVFVENDGVTRVRVQVDATVFTLQGGDAFSDTFRVVSLDSASGCGQFLYGDAPFQLCEGQQVVK